MSYNLHIQGYQYNSPPRHHIALFQTMWLLVLLELPVFIPAICKNSRSSQAITGLFLGCGWSFIIYIILMVGYEWSFIIYILLIEKPESLKCLSKLKNKIPLEMQQSTNYFVKLLLQKESFLMILLCRPKFKLSKYCKRIYRWTLIAQKNLCRNNLKNYEIQLFYQIASTVIQSHCEMTLTEIESKESKYVTNFALSNNLERTKLRCILIKLCRQ